MSRTMTSRGLWRRAAALASLALGLAASAPLAPASAQDAAHGCPQGQFESPESCSGRPLLSPAARLALRSGPTALRDGRKGEAYAVNVVASVGGSPARSEIEGRLPRGLSLEASGEIAGVPQEAGVFQFTIVLTDPATTPSRASQTYLLRIVGPTAASTPPRPVKKPAAPPSPAPTPPPASKPLPVVFSDEVAGAAVIYELSAADIVALTAPAKPKTDAAPGATGGTTTQTGAVQTQTAAPTAAALPSAPAPGAAPTAPTAAPGAAPVVAPRAAKPATAAQVAGVPGAAARAVGAPASVIKAAQAPADVVKRMNSLTNAFKPLTPKQGRPAPAGQPQPLNALPVQVAQPATVTTAYQAAAVTAMPTSPVYTTLPPDFATLAAPVLDVPYTSAELFKAALTARVRLAPALLDAVTARARHEVPYNKASALNWVSNDGCRCNALPHGPNDKIVYGFFPFWRSTATGPEVMFSRFNRIGLLGAQLQADGDWTYPSSPQKGADDWWAGLSRFAITAQAHGARLDLVLEGRDWAYLAQLDPQTRRATYEEAARKAMLLVDTPLQGRGLRALLLPFWRDPTYVFDGVTVLFDYPPDGAPAAEQAAFKDFYDGFLRELVHEMERGKRRTYALNIIGPDDMGEPEHAVERAKVWEDFLALKHLAEPASEHRDLPPTVAQLYVGTAKISVRLLTPLREPTTNAKKGIRAALDGIGDIKGLDRVEVQRSTVPILYLPETPFLKGKPQPRTMSVPASSQLSDDMVYLKQNFGGVGLWPLPVRGVEADEEVYHRIQQVFADEHVAWLGGAISICSLTLRLLLEVLLGLLVVGGIYYAIWGSASGRRNVYLIVLGVIGGLALLDFVFLLSFDPALEAIRIGNLPFITLLLILGAVAGWSLLRPRVPRP